MNSPQTTASELTAVADAIRGHERFVVTTHENPDGDALGSLLAMNVHIDQLGKDSVMVPHGDAPLPGEYAFMPLTELRRRWPDDVSERVLLAVDCANESRIADPEVLGRVPLSVDIDHHHDNTRFGRINLIVADASSTGEDLRDLLRELDVELTPEIAEALYIALVTDTGRFQYTNTTPKTLRLAAELVQAGAHVHRDFHVAYESVQFRKLQLLASARASPWRDRPRGQAGGTVIFRDRRRFASPHRCTHGPCGDSRSFCHGIAASVVRQSNQAGVMFRGSRQALRHGHRLERAHRDGRPTGADRRRARAPFARRARGAARGPPRGGGAADSGRLGGEDRRGGGGRHPPARRPG